MDDPDRTNTNEMPASSLLAQAPRVINVGLEMFAENLAGIGAEVIHVQWTPPAGGNAQLAALLDKLRR